MLQITPQMRVLVALEAVDGRKGIDSLVQLCREKLAADPFSGCVFIFRSRSATSIRLLAYDGQGFWLAQKRLSKGRFAGGPTAREQRVPSKLIRRSCWWQRESRHAGRADVAACQLKQKKFALGACVPRDFLSHCCCGRYLSPSRTSD